MKISKRWNCRINIIRYEDFLNDADYQAQEILNHLGGLNLSPKDKHFFFQTTHSGQPRNEFGKSEEEPWLPGEKKLDWIVANETSHWTFNTIKNSAGTGYKWALYRAVLDRYARDFRVKKSSWHIFRTAKSIFSTIFGSKNRLDTSLEPQN